MLLSHEKEGGRARRGLRGQSAAGGLEPIGGAQQREVGGSHAVGLLCSWVRSWLFVPEQGSVPCRYEDSSTWDGTCLFSTSSSRLVG